MGSFQAGGITEQIATTATAAGTTTLTETSKQIQVFTGTSSQTVVLPNATTMFAGQKFEIYNQSTGTLIIQYQDNTSFFSPTVTTGGSLVIKLISIGTANGTWVSPTAVSAGSPAVPTGAIIPHGSASAPTGFLNADGSAVSRTTFAVLFSVIGTTYGVGDGSTTFNVPNMQGVFPRGSGSQSIGGNSYSGTLGATSADQFQGHWHNDPGHVHTSNKERANINYAPVAGGTSHAVDSTVAPSSPGNILNTATTGITDPVTDGTNGTPRTGTQTHPANVGVNYIIKT